jgi:hypothetical protein
MNTSRQYSDTKNQNEFLKPLEGAKYHDAGAARAVSIRIFCCFNDTVGTPGQTERERERERDTKHVPLFINLNSSTSGTCWQATGAGKQQKTKDEEEALTRLAMYMYLEQLFVS